MAAKMIAFSYLLCGGVFAMCSRHVRKYMSLWKMSHATVNPLYEDILVDF